MWDYWWDMTEEDHAKATVGMSEEEAKEVNNYSNFVRDYKKMHSLFAEAFYMPHGKWPPKYNDGAVFAYHTWLYIGEHQHRIPHPTEPRTIRIKMDAMEEVSGFKPPYFCKVAINMKNGTTYAEGQKVTIRAHLQKPRLATDSGMAHNPHHEIQWTILKIVFGEGINKLSKTEEPMLLIFSEHSHYEKGKGDAPDQLVVTYPRWRYIPISRVKMIVTKDIVETTDKNLRAMARLAIVGRRNDPEDPNPPDLEAPPPTKGKKGKSKRQRADKEPPKKVSDTKKKEKTGAKGTKRKAMESMDSTDFDHGHGDRFPLDTPQWRAEEAKYKNKVLVLEEALAEAKREIKDNERASRELDCIKDSILTWAQTKLDVYNESATGSKKSVKHFIPTALHKYYPDVCNEK